MLTCNNSNNCVGTPINFNLNYVYNELKQKKNLLWTQFIIEGVIQANEIYILAQCILIS